MSYTDAKCRIVRWWTRRDECITLTNWKRMKCRTRTFPLVWSTSGLNWEIWIRGTMKTFPISTCGYSYSELQVCQTDTKSRSKNFWNCTWISNLTIKNRIISQSARRWIRSSRCPRNSVHLSITWFTNYSKNTMHLEFSTSA